MKIKYLVFLSIILLFAGCHTTKFPEMAFPPDREESLTLEETAKRIVKKDTGGAETLKINRVKYLLTELKDDSISFHSKGNFIEANQKILEESNGVKVTMTEFLEEMKRVKESRIVEILELSPTFMNWGVNASIKLGK